MGHREPGRELATLLQLLHRAREADSAAQLGFVMVNDTLQLLPYRQAAFWHTAWLPRVAAVSGHPDPDATAPYIQYLARLFRHMDTRQDRTTPVLLTCHDLPALLADEWAEWLPVQALWLPLADQGAVLLAGDTPWSAQALQLAEELAHGYAHALLAFAPQLDWRTRLGALWRPGTRRRVLVGLLVLACLPVRLSVLARAEVVPVAPVLLRAPVAGVIDTIAVNPNQPVAAGAALFDLDSTTLQGQYDLARSQKQAAEESFRASAQLAVTDDKGKLAMAQERARLEEKDISADYTHQELNRLHVTAPQAGVVVFSDRNDWQGKAVAQGEKVMTLADPSRVELAAWLPAADAIDVSPGTRVTLYPNGSPFSSYDAELVRVAYKAEVTEGNLLAYRLQARFVAGERLPQLGQAGMARIYGDHVPLIYYILRRPLTVARQWLGW